MVKSNALAVLISTVVLIGITLVIAPSISKANPFEYLLQNQGTFTVTATTSPVYMTAGTATTTYYYDSYANGSASTYATDKAALEMQFTASSTGSTIQGFYEYAQGNAAANCISAPTSCDWYTDETFLTANSTTTPTINITQPNQIIWNFASTTPAAGGSLVSNNRVNKVITVPTPTRYVRVVLFMPVGSTNGAIWAAFVGQKQIPN